MNFSIHFLSKPEFLNYLAERIIGILFEKARAGIPAGSATDACRTIIITFTTCLLLFLIDSRQRFDRDSVIPLALFHSARLQVCKFVIYVIIGIPKQQ
jgi:hypothetical protein